MNDDSQPESGRTIEGVQFYKSVKTIVEVNDSLPDAEKREIIEMVIDEEL